MRARVDLTLIEGATYRKRFRWKSGDPAQPVDLTGWTGFMQIRERIEDPEPIITLSTENGRFRVLDQTANQGFYEIEIEETEARKLAPDHRQRVAVYDLFLYDDGVTPDARAHQYGNVTIEPVAARP